MFPTRIQEAGTQCKCCGAPALLFGVCDLSKNCEQAKGLQLPLTGIPIYYYRCSRCQFIFTTQFDNASRDDFRRHIYNDDYLQVDPEFLSIRPARTAQMLMTTFGDFKQSLSILDYGGGNGMLARQLRERGFSNVETYDPFYEEFATRPTARFNLVLAIEVVEHVPHPLETFREIADLMDEKQSLFLISTSTVPANIDTVGVSWWYIAPRNGHISIHSVQSLTIVLQKCGLHHVSSDNSMHGAYRDIPDFARHVLQTPA